MPLKIKAYLKTVLNSILNKRGYSIVLSGDISNSDFHKTQLIDECLGLLKHIQFSPNHIVDIGANHGTWTRHALNYFPDAKYTMIDPQKWLQPSFQDILDKNKNVKFYPVGVGEHSGTFMFTMHERDDSRNFSMTKEIAQARGFDQIELPVITLNDLIGANNLTAPDLIKIDAEGLDIEVLKGATNFLGLTEVIFVEAGVMSKGIKNDVLSVVQFMDANGYRLFDITDLNKPHNVSLLWLVELVFIKRGGYIDNLKIV
jgi:FkbM family methyltransferase